MNSVNIWFIFKCLYVWTYKRVELSSEAPSVESGHFSHERAALTSPALHNPSQVCPTSWLQGALKARLFSVVNASLPAICTYEYQLLRAPAFSCWTWGSQKESVPERQAGDMDHKGYIYKKVERMEALLQASSTPLPQSFLMHLVATTSSQSASEFLHWFITFSQPPLIFSLVLDPSISLIPFFFFPTGHDRLSICPHSFLLLCSRQMEKLMITLAKASFAALNNRSTEKHISRKFKPNVSLNQTKQFGLPVQYMCHLHFQNSVLKGFRTVARWCGTV